jgi:hypothetical protein
MSPSPVSAVSATPVLTPEVLEDDAGTVPHAQLALFDDGDMDGASLRYWATGRAVVIQSMESSARTRGRDMLRWLGQQTRLPIVVVEAVPSAYGFWDKMQAEGRVARVEEATGEPSRYEALSRPWPRRRPEPAARRRPKGP